MFLIVSKKKGRVYSERRIEEVTFYVIFSGGAQIISHSRQVDDSVRRKESKRQKERERKKARKAEQLRQKSEEIARARNQKMKEIRDRLKEIKEITGNDCKYIYTYIHLYIKCEQNNSLK